MFWCGTHRASPAYQYESNEYRNKFYRHISEGGWPFSTSAHGWPISDCTSEGLKGTIALLKSKTVQEGLKDESLKKISAERLYKAVNVLLTYQNEDGGELHITVLETREMCGVQIIKNWSTHWIFALRPVRLGHVRKQPWMGLVRTIEPQRSFWGYYDRLLLCGMQYGRIDCSR